MAAEEEESEGVVLLRGGALARQVENSSGLLSMLSRGLASPGVDEASRGHGQQPRSGVVGHAVGGPLPGSGEKRFLHGVLARVELRVPPHERAQDLRRKLAHQVLDGRLCPQNSGGASMTCRTSIGCFTKATIFEAISIARASLSTSTIQ